MKNDQTEIFHDLLRKINKKSLKNDIETIILGNMCGSEGSKT